MKYFNNSTKIILDANDDSGNCLEITDEVATALQIKLDAPAPVTKWHNTNLNTILDDDDASGDCIEVSLDDATFIQNRIDTLDDTVELQWTAAELAIADEQIACHLDGDPNAISTEALWRAHRVDCRAHKAEPVGLLANRPVRPS
jgi:hypothetical protein